MRQTRKNISVGANESARLGFRLSRSFFRKLDRAGALAVTLVLTSQYGTVTTPLNLER